jgi:predicted deacylase
MIDQGMLTGAPLPPGPAPFVGNDTLDIGSPRGGYAHLLVGLGDDVKAGQEIATVTNAFGDVLARVVSPRSGHVLSIATDPRRDQGEMLVRLIRWSETGVCHQDGCAADAKAPRSN